MDRETDRPAGSLGRIAHRTDAAGPPTAGSRWGALTAGPVGRLSAAIFARVTGRRVLHAGITAHLLLGVTHLWLSVGAGDAGPALLFESAVFLGAPVLMVLLVRHLEARFPAEIHYWQLVFAGVLGTALAVLLGGLYALDLRLDGGTLAAPRTMLLLAADFGGPMGLVMGWQETVARRSHTRARTAELRGRLLAAQERRLTFLNRVLRHHLLNGLSVIAGASYNLRAGQPDPEERYLDMIDGRVDALVDEIERMRTVVNSLAGDAQAGPTDVRTVLEGAVEACRGAHPAVTVRTELAGTPVVRVATSLRLVLEAVLENAVIHNDADRPRVTVGLATAGATARITVADNGPGIPDDRKQRYFERGELGLESLGEGLGLYLADVVTAAAGGEVRIADNRPRGTRVVIELPVASATDRPVPRDWRPSPSVGLGAAGAAATTRADGGLEDRGDAGEGAP